MKSKLLSIILLTIVSQLSFSQDNSIYFQGENITITKNIDSFKTTNLSSNKIVNQGFYGWIQFNNTPNQQLQDKFKNKGLRLINYIDKKTYLFYFPIKNLDKTFLKQSGVSAIIPMDNRFKMESSIKNDVIGSWAIEGNKVLLSIQHFKNINSDFALSEILKIKGLEIRKQYKNSNILDVAIPKINIKELVSLPIIKWVELIPEPSVKEDTRGRSIHRASNLDTQTPGGRNFTGEGIGVLVRDDGVVGPHIDFQGRIDNSAASGTSTSNDHGDGVAGIMAGAGNLDPTKRGMAAGSSVYVVNYEASFLDSATTTLINNGTVHITNSSYGNGCNAGYTSTAQTVDTQSNENLSLLHVFSAGNSGTNTGCGYVSGSAWGNITGGHKQGKNVIATANVYYNGGHVASSSHGPAYDGRIKPDITAHGQGQQSTDDGNTYQSFGGTSGAAPGIAGVSAQLYQLYKEANAGVLPEAALIKATLLNTANDMGNVGPDFQYGWGLVNGLRAAKLLEEQRYLQDQATQGNTKTHTINVPAGTTQVRFMVYWNDPAATAGTAKALLNDLDLRVKNPSNTEFLPWILNHAPDGTTLNDPATTGVDRLNNMEQVLINTPEAGNYTIEVEGFDVPQGPQKYFIVYEIITDNMVLTYPQGGEKMVAGETETIHWDATNITDTISLEYSADAGATWTTIQTGIVTTEKNYDWSIPTGLTPGEYLIRATTGSYTSTSQKFTIAGMVSGINITQVCPTEITVAWDALPNATEYKVYMLGEKYMDEVGTTTATSFAIPITNVNADFWVAVSANGTTWKTRRSVAKHRAGGLYNCTLANDMGVVSIEGNFSNIICQTTNTVAVSAVISNSGSSPQSNFTVSYQLDTNTVVEETYAGTLANGAQETYTFATPLQITSNGSHTLKVFVTLSGDENSANNEQTHSFYSQVSGAPLNTVETFNTGFPPEGWKVVNPDNDTYTWVEATVTGSDGQSTKAAYLKHSGYSTSGRLDHILTQIYDLTNASSSSLSFDLAKAQWSSSYTDGLKVEVSTDCGSTYTTVYDKTGLDLSTITGYQSSLWTPTEAAHWRKETIDLAAYIGQKVQVRFTSVNGYGNSTYVDNVEMTSTLSNEKNNLNDLILVFPNAVSDKLQIQLTNSQKIKSLKIYSILGKKVALSNLVTTKNNGVEVDMTTFSSGIYVVKIETNEGLGYKKVIKK